MVGKVSILTICIVILVILAIIANVALTNHASGSLQQPATILPGPFPSGACHPHVQQSYSNITTVTGLSAYNLSGTEDYVISPGGSGRISYTTYVGKNIGEGEAGTNTTNWADFYHLSTNNLTGNTYPGMNVSIQPPSETFYFNSSYTVGVGVTALPNATRGTYWVVLSPGICQGGPVFLLTVGNAPYNGTIPNGTAVGNINPT
jgi:hypothetical protein